MRKDVPYSRFISTQGSMLRLLIKSIYFSLDIRKEEPRLRVPTSISRMKYVLGGEVFRTRPEGVVIIGLLIDGLSIISCPRWYEDHNWSEFLGETLSVMLANSLKTLMYGTEVPI
ncbi:uncharacterized protein ASPGLDRAFT_1359916 [Aspergillus glaucus CBS 516.65]|uniref:Uncharacterized protein n=1 Tax=Aspergillus glaucus CBS 516.65 TaxID=1160497 RepID=A0A1L9VNL5_ASPGL|nr:hypothetical protein ASPGLDRAFT_1359916 [Aspergillus glaucus CBS 516.65]OJJ85523.1 hypothetical protein ASPGLDRAFT_1359916 [Aspergillus glaucus CBS 516.65]